MQVASSFNSSCPFLLESDVLSLSSSFGVNKSQGTLRDHDLGAVHSLSEIGLLLALSLRREASFAQLQALGERYQVAPTYIHEFLGFLNCLGALQRRPRRLPERLRAGAIQARLAARRLVYPGLTWRQEASAARLAWASWRVCRPVLVAGVAVAWLLVASGLLLPGQALRLAAVGLGLFVSSIYVHEYAHWWAISHYGASAVLLQRGLRLGIVHPQLSPGRELVSAVAGPAVGFGWCVLWASATMVAELGYIIAAFHSLSLLPGYGDGRSIANAIQKLKPRVSYET